MDTVEVVGDYLNNKFAGYWNGSIMITEIDVENNGVIAPRVVVFLSNKLRDPELIKKLTNLSVPVFRSTRYKAHSENAARLVRQNEAAQEKATGGRWGKVNASIQQIAICDEYCELDHQIFEQSEKVATPEDSYGRIGDVVLDRRRVKQWQTMYNYKRQYQAIREAMRRGAVGGSAVEEGAAGQEAFVQE